jgi:hypothetical protein
MELGCVWLENCLSHALLYGAKLWEVNSRPPFYFRLFGLVMLSGSVAHKGLPEEYRSPAHAMEGQ